MMSSLHKIFFFALMVVGAFVPLVASSSALDEDDTFDSWTHGEVGLLRYVRSSDEEELKKACECVNNGLWYTMECIKLSRNYHTIRKGRCSSNTNTRISRSSFQQSGISFSSRPTFVENKECRASGNILLASSGSEKHLTLTTPGSVFICSGSIDADLQQLSVVNVSKLLIGPEALKPRDSDVQIRLSGIQEKITFPEEALSVQIDIPETSSQPSDDLIEVDTIQKPPPIVKLKVESAQEIEFRSRSVVAPRLELRLNQIQNVVFGSKSIIPYAQPEASSLTINECHSVTMETQTTNTGKFEAKFIKNLFMKENALKIVSDIGAKAKIENVGNMTLADRALGIGSGANIHLNNVTFTTAGVRAIHAIGKGYLTRAAFVYVTGKDLAPAAICIKAETVVVYTVEIKENNNDHVGACIEGRTLHQGDYSGVAVICQTQENSKYLCNNPSCAPCTPEEDVTSIVPIVDTDPDTTVNSAVPASSVNPATSTIGNPASIITFNPIKLVTIAAATRHTTIAMIQDPNSSFFRCFLPDYIIIIFICVGVVLLIIMSYMIYRHCNRRRYDKYDLPQEIRMPTFHNPRTITTPENLESQSNSANCNNANATENSMHCDSNQHRTETYTLNSEPYYKAPCTDDDMNSVSSQMTSEIGEPLPPPGYQQPDYRSEELPGERLAPDTDYRHHSECEVLPSDYFTSGGRLSVSDSHLPPPEGYNYSADDQKPVEDSLPSEDELSIPEKGFVSPDNNLSPNEDQPNLPDNQPLMSDDQRPTQHDVTIPNEQMSPQDKDLHFHENQLPSVNEESSP